MLSCLANESLSIVQVLCWTLTGLAVLLKIGRYIVRYKLALQFQLDDCIHGLATIILVALGGTYTSFIPLNHIIENWQDGNLAAPSNSDLHRYWQLEIAIAMQFWLVIYLVKFAFLMFYRKLFGVSQNFLVAWWLVSAFTILTYLMIIISIFWACGVPQNLFNLGDCNLFGQHGSSTNSTQVLVFRMTLQASRITSLKCGV